MAIESIVDLKNAVLDEIAKLYEPDKVTDFEIIRSDFWPTCVYTDFSINVRGQKKTFHAKIDKPTGHVGDLTLTSSGVTTP
jgi:hypothetical protein